MDKMEGRPEQRTAFYYKAADVFLFYHHEMRSVI